MFDGGAFELRPFGAGGRAVFGAPVACSFPMSRGRLEVFGGDAPTEVADAMRVWVDDEGVLRAVCEPDAQISIDELLEYIEVARRLTHGRRLPTILDLRGLVAITSSARTYWVSREADVIASATAVLVERGPSRVIGHFLAGRSREEHPVRLFEGEKEAVQWLARR